MTRIPLSDGDMIVPNLIAAEHRSKSAQQMDKEIQAVISENIRLKRELTAEKSARQSVEEENSRLSWENIHLYQYRHRPPLDLETLLKKKKK